MSKGISLHIGLNSVDPAQYEGWSGDLLACEYDANDMVALARDRGFTTRTKLLTRNATSRRVANAITKAAQQLRSGDIFFVSYSGHGGQVPDTNGEEDDGMDETWVLYDRMLVDDELYALWSKFRKGVRIVVLSDSCHSGSVIKFVPDFVEGKSSGRRPRAMPSAVGKRTYAAHQRTYDDIQKKVPDSAKAKVAASVLLISGCQDEQTSLDGDRNGLFTEKLRTVWNDGAFKGGYTRFHKDILALMPKKQQPDFFPTGASLAGFHAQHPFSI